MCQYYAHSFTCKHTSLSFARFCRDASMIQTPCAELRDVWATINMQEACDACVVSLASRSTWDSMEHHHHQRRRRG